ncbi:MAG: integrin alpha [Myxococcota bacterium]
MILLLLACELPDDTSRPDTDEEEKAADTEDSAGPDDSADTGSLDDSGETGDPDTDTGPRDTRAYTLSADLGAKLVGEEAEDANGHRTDVDGAGDVDGDGALDLLVAQARNDRGGEDAGAVYVVRGPVYGTVDLSAADAVLFGSTPGELAGWIADGVGDVDADGYADLLVGAPSWPGARPYEGRAYLVRGPVTGALDLATADAVLHGEPSPHAWCEIWSQTGESLGAAGDVDGDGHDDVLVGAPGHGCGKGAAWLLYGPVDGTIELATDADTTFVGEGYAVGYFVASAGDTDGDGRPDPLIGVPTGERRLAIFQSPGVGILSIDEADAWLIEGADGFEGTGGLHLGDTNGDGHDDLLTGNSLSDENGDSAGAASLFLGPFHGGRSLDAPDARLLGDAPRALVHGNRAAGDVDGDGRADLLLSGSTYARGEWRAGTSYVVFGPVAGTLVVDGADLILYGEGGDDAAGGGASPGDIDGDGLDDLIIGGGGDDDGGEDAGAAWLVYAANLE